MTSHGHFHGLPHPGKNGGPLKKIVYLFCSLPKLAFLALIIIAYIIPAIIELLIGAPWPTFKKH